MKAARKKTKAKSKVKSNKVKAKKVKARKVKAKKVKAGKVKAKKPKARKATASALKLRKVIDRPGAAIAESSASSCYTKSGDSSTVSIWSGGFKVRETSEADAKASGIPPCG